MARVPQHIAPGKIVVVSTTASVAEQKKFLADFDRKLAVIDAKNLNKNDNYE